MSPEPAPALPPSLPPPIVAHSDPPQIKGMSERARLIGVLFSPGKAFADIARRPRWWIPVILIAIISTIYLTAFTQLVGWESVIRPSIEQLPNAQTMTVQQREQ